MGEPELALGSRERTTRQGVAKLGWSVAKLCRLQSEGLPAAQRLLFFMGWTIFRNELRERPKTVVKEITIVPSSIQFSSRT